jgi:hypothetical protein
VGSPTSLLQGARAFARDYPRDQMPRGYLWDVVDYVPLIIDAPLTGRGAWKWGSDVADADFESGILATFTTGEQPLFQTTNGTVYQVNPSPPYGLTNRGASVRSLQNPTQLKNDVVNPDASGGQVFHIWRSGGIVAGAGGAGRNAKYASVYKSMLVTGGAPGEDDVIRFSVPGKTLDDGASYDANSFYRTTQSVTGLAALRAAVLVFHPGSVERLRGSTPAHGTTEKGDMFIEPLFDRVGCKQPRSITLWNDNCIFADEHGVHITDAATVRNLVSQGGILYYWRVLYDSVISITACTFLDYYIITLRRSTAPTPVTLICDLNKRQWFRFTNIDSLVYVASGGSTGMERIWAGIAGSKRLARIGPCFFPVSGGATSVDDNGVAVLPIFETPWYRLGVEGRKRIRFAYLSYDVRLSGTTAAGWRGLTEEDLPPQAPPEVLAALAPILNVGYIRSPQEQTYTALGNLPATSDYRRFKLPLGQFPYGAAFKVTQTQASSVTRIFDFAVEAQPAERSRV